MNILKKLRHKKQDFNARMRMERAAQEDMEARLARMELSYKNKTRTK